MPEHAAGDSEVHAATPTHNDLTTLAWCELYFPMGYKALPAKAGAVIAERALIHLSDRGAGRTHAGYGVTVKLVTLVPAPPAVVTAIGPVTAPVGTSAFTSVSEITW